MTLKGDGNGDVVILAASYASSIVLGAFVPSAVCLFPRALLAPLGAFAGAFFSAEGLFSLAFVAALGAFERSLLRPLALLVDALLPVSMSERLLDDELRRRQVAAIADGLEDHLCRDGLAGEELALAGTLLLFLPGGVERAEGRIGVDPAIELRAADTGERRGVGDCRIGLVEPIPRLALGRAESHRQLHRGSRWRRWKCGLRLNIPRSGRCS